MRIQMIVALSTEAQQYLSDHNEDYEKMTKSRKLSEGYDFKVKTFKNNSEALAYQAGLEDGNGWMNEVAWSKKELK